MTKLYSKEFRERAVACVKEGKSRTSICAFFGIGIATLDRWLRLQREHGSVEAKKRGTYQPRKVDASALQAAIAAQPDATLEELAHLFDCSHQTIDYWCRKLGITRKKNHAVRGKRYTKKAGVSGRDQGY